MEFGIKGMPRKNKNPMKHDQQSKQVRDTAMAWLINSRLYPNSTKKQIGKSYPVRRFGVGDKVESRFQYEGKVISRDEKSITIQWCKGLTFHPFLTETNFIYLG